MRKLILAASLVLAFVIPAVAVAKPPTRAHVREYVHAYRAARGKFGARAVGCDLLGRRGSCHRRVSDRAVIKSVGVLERMLTPPPVTLNPPAPVAVVLQPGLPNVTVPQFTTSAQSPSYGSGPSSLPACTWVPESGGNWNAVNPSSGAYGRYQILPSTAAAHGCNLSTHQGQNDCASAIWANGSGRSQWVNC